MGLPYPKQFLPFRGHTLIEHTVSLFQGLTEELIVPVPAPFLARFRDLLKGQARVIPGGESRFESVKNGFLALNQLHDEDLVLIHDAARPFLDVSTLKHAIEQTNRYGAVIYAARATDTVKLTDNNKRIINTLDRNSIFLAQTPQIFQAGILKKCYKIYKSELDHPTDEAAMLEACGFPVHIVESTPRNKKITLKEDMDHIESNNTRIGHGYDVHRFDEKRPLVLCGLKLPTEPGLLGHSDADVALHALMDALLGACALGDIGQHFPDTDARYKGIESSLLLKKVLKLLDKRGVELINIDLTILAQIPKLAPFMSAMRQNLALLLNLPEERVNIKATTTEGLGYIGEKKGMAAHCVVLVSQSKGENIA